MRERREKLAEDGKLTVIEFFQLGNIAQQWLALNEFPSDIQADSWFPQGEVTYAIASARDPVVPLVTPVCEQKASICTRRQIISDLHAPGLALFFKLGNFSFETWLKQNGLENSGITPNSLVPEEIGLVFWWR